ncbi:MAG: Asp-tRNA(Asn)/Glu-tRNA(Gln) amidotransferase subunit GatB [Clostridia bacterium]|nr:Asp-tRNA(Asn)/Glu-tRNA(Gln) amidotransferase subunit GatB [Clostridia bacterium]
MEYKGYEPIVGLELHVELKTELKAFCTCSAEFGGEINTKCCPVCLGKGGVPVFNTEAHERGIAAALALGCKVAETSYFDRKHYVSRDLPKGYQITQYYTPLAQNGSVTVCVNGEEKTVAVERIQLEEDAGRIVRRGDGEVIDFNRCGIPLIEIITAPCIRSGDEAEAVVEEIRRRLLFAGVSDCKMNEGSLRCDVNVSVRPVGSDAFGARCEIKNIGSVDGVGRAIAHETERQTELLLQGGTVAVETRRFDEKSGTTVRMRDKETAADYGYVRERDLPPLVTDGETVERVRLAMPASYAVREKLLLTAGVSEQNTSVILSSVESADYFGRVMEQDVPVPGAANLFVSEVYPSWDSRPDEEAFAQCVKLFASGEVTVVSVRELIKLSAETGGSPRAIAEKRGMLTIRDEEVIASLVREAAEACTGAVEDVRRGKDAAKKVLVGYVMRHSRGRADPASVNKAVDRYFEK